MTGFVALIGSGGVAVAQPTIDSPSGTVTSLPVNFSGTVQSDTTSVTLTIKQGGPAPSGSDNNGQTVLSSPTDIHVDTANDTWELALGPDDSTTAELLNGEYTLEIVTFDSNQNSNGSAAKTITVNAPSQPGFFSSSPTQVIAEANLDQINVVNPVFGLPEILYQIRSNPSAGGFELDQPDTDIAQGDQVTLTQDTGGRIPLMIATSGDPFFANGFQGWTFDAGTDTLTIQAETVQQHFEFGGSSGTEQSVLGFLDILYDDDPNQTGFFDDFRGTYLASNAQSFSILFPSQQDPSIGLGLTGPNGTTAFWELFLPISTLQAFLGQAAGCDDLPPVEVGNTTETANVTTVTGNQGNVLGCVVRVDVTFGNVSSSRLHTGAVQATATSSVDVKQSLQQQGDNDGVDASVEDDAPNGGDGNNDGTPDSQQANVTSLPSTKSGSYVTVESPAGTSLRNVQSTADAGASSSPPTPNGLDDFPDGFVGFELDVASPGDAATVTLTFHSANMPASYWKYGPTPSNPSDHWYEFTYNGTTGAQITGNTVTLQFVDGGRGDHDLTANGTIVDPGGAFLEARTDTGAVVGGVPPLWGDTLVFPTPETFYGFDLNGDFDTQDAVLRIKNVRTGHVTNTGIPVSNHHRAVDLYEEHAVFVMQESGLSDPTGLFNLWGTTRTDEGPIGVLNVESGEVQMLDVWGTRPTIHENIVTISGSTLRYYDLSEDRLVNTGLSGTRPAVWGDWIVYEREMHGVPRLQLYNLQTHGTQDTGIAGAYPAIHEGKVAFTTEESWVDRDLNGDGDTHDTVVRAYDIANDRVINTAQAGQDPAIYGDRIPFSQGRAILYHDLSAGRTYATGQQGAEPDIYQDTVTSYVWEDWAGADLSGDHDRYDPIVQTHHASDADRILPQPQIAALPQPEPLAVERVFSSRQSNGIRVAVQGQGIERVELTVFDLSGGRVVHKRSSGSQLTWHLSTDDGRRVANGVYLYMVTARGADGQIARSEVRKLVVLR